MIEFKNDKARETYPNCKEELKDAIFWCSQWADKRKLPFVITRAIDEMIPNVSKTNIHADGRAVDVSIKGFDTDALDDLVSDSNKKFSESIGAFSISDGISRFCVLHDAGAGAHLHFQVRKS